MKKNIFFAILGLTLVLFAASCSKSDPTPVTNSSAEGIWTGGYSYGGPSYYFLLNLKAGGALVVEANSSTSPDIANGTWSLVADSVRATFTYIGGASGTYSLAGKYSTSSKIMNGTLGLGTNTTGVGTFSVTRP